MEPPPSSSFSSYLCGEMATLVTRKVAACGFRARCARKRARNCGSARSALPLHYQPMRERACRDVTRPVSSFTGSLSAGTSRTRTGCTFCVGPLAKWNEVRRGARPPRRLSRRLVCLCQFAWRVRARATKPVSSVASPRKQRQGRLPRISHRLGRRSAGLFRRARGLSPKGFASTTRVTAAPSF